MTDSPVGLREFNRIVRTTLLVPVTVLALLAGLLVWQVERALELRQQTIVISRFVDQLLTLQQHAVDQEAGLPPYALSGLPAVLAPYNAPGPEMETELSLVRQPPSISGVSAAEAAKLEKDV